VNKKLDKLLCERYPKIFRDRYASPMTTCMCWGFPGDGWFFIIDTLCRRIQSRIDHSVETAGWHMELHAKYVRENGKAYAQEWSPYTGYEPIPQVVALQVKEKFGTLRFYYSGGDEVIGGYVAMAEAMSAYTCESCGRADGTVGRTIGWISTCCEDCYAKHERKQKWQHVHPSVVRRNTKRP